MLFRRIIPSIVSVMYAGDGIFFQHCFGLRQGDLHGIYINTFQHFDLYMPHFYCAQAKCGCCSYNQLRNTISLSAALFFMVIFLPCTYSTYTNEQEDDCESCAVPQYAPVSGSAVCSPCGSGTLTLDGSLDCIDCATGVYPKNVSYLGWCSVKSQTFQLLLDNEIQHSAMHNLTVAVVYYGPENTIWFSIPIPTISLRSILNSLQLDWAVGTQVRIHSALGQSRVLNAIVLQRIRIGEEGLWSPANVSPMHTTDSTRYVIIN